MNRCIVRRLTNLRPHADVPELDVGECGSHQVVVGRHYDEGILGIFIPDGSIIPDQLADEMWVKGKLAGKKGNRVKARLRGNVMSEGLFYGSNFYLVEDGARTYYRGPSWNPEWVEGQDVTNEIGVTYGD